MELGLEGKGGYGRQNRGKGPSASMALTKVQREDPGREKVSVSISKPCSEVDRVYPASCSRVGMGKMWVDRRRPSCLSLDTMHNGKKAAATSPSEEDLGRALFFVWASLVLTANQRNPEDGLAPYPHLSGSGTLEGITVFSG